MFEYISQLSFVEIINIIFNSSIIFAILKYIFYKEQKIKIAAKILLNQIKELETEITGLKNQYPLDNPKVYESNFTLTINEWDNQKHLLVDKLSESDYKIISDFYFYAKHIYKSKTLLSKIAQISKCPPVIARLC